MRVATRTTTRQRANEAENSQESFDVLRFLCLFAGTRLSNPPWPSYPPFPLHP